MQAEIYSKDYCPSCVSAKALLNQRGIDYTEIDAVTEREALIERVTADTGKAPATVPQIYLDGSHIGGYEALVAYFKRMDYQSDDAA